MTLIRNSDHIATIREHDGGRTFRTLLVLAGCLALWAVAIWIVAPLVS